MRDFFCFSKWQRQRVRVKSSIISINKWNLNKSDFLKKWKGEGCLMRKHEALSNLFFYRVQGNDKLLLFSIKNVSIYLWQHHFPQHNPLLIFL